MKTKIILWATFALFAINLHAQNSSFSNFLLHTKTALDPAGNTFFFELGDYNNDGKLDLYAIKGKDVGSGKTEVHILNGADNFQTFLLHTATPLHKLDNYANFHFELGDYNNDGKLDLYIIKTRDTGGGKTEVHILNGADNFQTFLIQTETAGPELNYYANFRFELGDYNNDGKLDLYAINEGVDTESKKNEVHILNGADNFQTFLFQTVTILDHTAPNGHFTLALGDYNNDGKLDLYAIKTSGLIDPNMKPHKTEVSILNGADNFKTFLIQTKIALDPSVNTFDFLLGDYNNDGNIDFYAIKKTDTGSGKTEVHVLDGLVVATNQVISAKFEAVTETVLKKPAYTRIEVIPAELETVTERVLKKSAGTECSTYEAVSEQSLKKEPYVRIEVIPAEFETVTEQALLREATENSSAEYQTITKSVVKAPAQTRFFEVPAEYQTITKEVVLEAGTESCPKVPAEYQTISKSVVKTPAKTRVIEVPAEYQTVTRYLLKK